MPTIMEDTKVSEAMDSKVYKGVVEGRELSSTYPNVYRAQYCINFGGRVLIHINEMITAVDEYHARERCNKGNVKGGVKVTLIGTLALVD